MTVRKLEERGDQQLAVKLSNITKNFDGRPALSNASLQVRWGEVHALLGENGAGKSTLMNVACGMYSPDDGDLAIAGKYNHVSGPSDAIRYGIGIVHQHFKLVHRFTVAENIRLYCGNMLDVSSAADIKQLILKKSGELGLEVNPDAIIDEISVAEQQRVEILKIILAGARILILDEPTAVLTDSESEAVLSLLQRMANDGCAVILITHKLREVLRFSDRVTVMRSGETTLQGAQIKGLKKADLARAMVGESTKEQKRETWAMGDNRLKVTQISVSGADEIGGIRDVSLNVRAGEIYGIAGVGGNGQPELVDALIGLSATTSGTIQLDAREITGLTINHRRNAGVRFIPADRFKSGLVADLAAYENFTVTEVLNGKYGSWLKVNRAAMRHDTAQAIKDQQILGCTPPTLARLLSGGNAQKLLLAREMDKSAALIVAHSPTRGLDIQACEVVHTALLNAAKAGAACLLVSEDLEEILALSDTIGVMSGGEIVGEFAAKDASREKIGELMLGHA